MTMLLDRTIIDDLPFPEWTKMTAEKIEQAIPHRLPMRLLDEIVEEGEGFVICKKTFHEDDFFVQGHFPDYPLVPGVIQCECCLQAGAIVLSRQTPKEGVVPVATRMDNVKFKRMVRPGDTVLVEARLNDHLGAAYYLTGKVTLDGKLAARLDFACSVADPREAS